MLDREQIVQNALQKVIESTDLDPGEVNRNITKVMKTMQVANSQFQEMDDHVAELIKASKRLDDSGTEVAQAGVDVARASQNLAESVDDLNDTQEELQNDINDLSNTLERLEQYMPEEE
jgi:methyl-accepting chemotaxis protein